MLAKKQKRPAHFTNSNQVHPCGQKREYYNAKSIIIRSKVKEKKKEKNFLFYYLQ